MNKIYILILSALIGCKSDPTKTFKISDDKTINVSTRITDIPTEQIIAFPQITLLDQYILLTDHKASFDKGIHVLDRDSLNYLTSTGFIGEGPGEIMRYGEVGTSQRGNEFWMPDFGKMKAFKFDIDSVLLDSNYKPSISKDFKQDFFLTRLKFVSDDLAVGTGVEVLSPSTFRTSLGRWDLNTGRIEKFGFEHPKLIRERTNAYIDYSYKHKIIALAYTNFYIVSVFDPAGNLKFNIKGEKEFDNQERTFGFFSQVFVTDDYIVTSYLGGPNFDLDVNQATQSIRPSKILFFDLDGKLIKIFETGHQIMYFAVDDDNNRVICFFLDREVPIGYFEY